jgi:hypothetical protein
VRLGQTNGGILRNQNADKAAEYTHYAEHCVETAKILPDQEDRTLHREMAAEWLRLAELIAERATLSAQPSLKRRKTSRG